ncbi:MAG: hypothetical protein ACREN7_10520 [Candidatus Dormibacteria bacterium]
MEPRKSGAEAQSEAQRHRLGGAQVRQSTRRGVPLLITSDGFAYYTAAALVVNSGWKRPILALFGDV